VDATGTSRRGVDARPRYRHVSDYSRDLPKIIPPRCSAAFVTLEDQDRFALASSLHLSHWTLDALADYTEFCIAIYRDPQLRARLETKYQHHLESGEPGDVCDMTALHLWRERNEQGVWNLAAVAQGMAGDLAVSTGSNRVANEYETRNGFKHFEFRGGVPYARAVDSGQDVRFLCVHCQGESKRLMTAASLLRARGTVT
jgi:hypothetical protein